MKFDEFAHVMNDAHWVDQYQSDNQEGMRVLYQRYYLKVYRKCLTFCKDPDDAFDLAQDALLKAFEHLHSFKGDSSFSTWLYTLTYNHCREVFRKSKHMVMSRLTENYEGDQADFTEAFAEGSMSRESAESTMLALLSTLPEIDQAMLQRKYHDGQSIEQIQTHFMLSASAIKMRLKRAKTKLNVLYVNAVR